MVVVTVVTFVMVVPRVLCPLCAEVVFEFEDPADPKEEESDCIEADMTDVFEEPFPEPGIHTPLTKLKPGLHELQIPVLVSAEEQLGVTAVHTLLLR